MSDVLRERKKALVQSLCENKKRGTQVRSVFHRAELRH